MKILVSGDTDFDDHKLLRKKMDVLTINLTEIEVVTGNRRGWRPTLKNDKLNHHTGAEHWAQIWCDENRYAYHICHGDVKGHGINEEMVKLADAAVIFTNGFAKDLIRLCKKAKLKTRVVRY